MLRLFACGFRRRLHFHKVGIVGSRHLFHKVGIVGIPCIGSDDLRNQCKSIVTQRGR
jgi:hypothetical protein